MGGGLIAGFFYTCFQMPPRISKRGSCSPSVHWLVRWSVSRTNYVTVT